MGSNSMRALRVAVVCACFGLASCIYVGPGVRLPTVVVPTLSGPWTVDGPLTVNGPLTVSGPVVVHGTVKCREIQASGGMSTISPPAHGKPGPAGQSVNGPMTVAGPLTVNGPLTVDGPLTVSGWLTAEGFDFLRSP